MVRKRFRRPRWLSRSLHRWFGLFVGPLWAIWAASGLVLNHRAAVAHWSIPRRWLPAAYRWNNWNLGAIRGGRVEPDGSVLVWGNIGIWRTDGTWSTWKEQMEGLPAGVDARRTFAVVRSPAGHLYAGSQSGLYRFDTAKQRWTVIPCPSRDPRICDLVPAPDGVIAVARDELFHLRDDAPHPVPRRIRLEPAADDDGRVSLFRLLWHLHSGELFGGLGVALMDFVALVVIALVVTGWLYFLVPRWIRRRVRAGRPATQLGRLARPLTRWHRRLGALTALALGISALTGSVLRPPLLIPIAGRRVPPPIGTWMAGPNRWADRLRALAPLPSGDWVLATDEALFRVRADFSGRPVRWEGGPPLSVMGVNVLMPAGGDALLVGSFAGLFVWRPELGWSCDYFTGLTPSSGGAQLRRPIGDHLISGLVRLPDQTLVFDYSRGLLNANVPMPREMDAIGLPIWNLAQEIHTGRFFQRWLGPAYVLLVPLLGLAAVVIVLAGVRVWWPARTPL